MKHFAILVWSIMKMTARNKQSLFWMFVFPVIVMSLLGIVFGSGISKPKVGLVLEGKSKLAKNTSITIKKIDAMAYSEGSKKEMIEQLKEGKIDSLIVIPKDFGVGLGVSPKNQSSLLLKKPVKQSSVDVYNDPSAIFTSNIVRGVINNVLQEVNRSITKAPLLIKMTNHDVRSKSLRYIDFLLPGIIAMTLMNSALFGLGGMVVRYRERGILKRIRVTPQPLYQFLGAHIIAQVFFALLRTALLIVVAVLLFGAKMLASIPMLILVTLIGSVCFITISLTIASISKNREVSDTLSNIVSMPMLFLSGVFFPVDNVPNWIKPIIKALPLKYLTDSLRGVMVRGLGVGAIEKELLYLGIITFVFFIISIKVFRWE